MAALIRFEDIEERLRGLIGGERTSDQPVVRFDSETLCADHVGNQNTRMSNESTP